MKMTMSCTCQSAHTSLSVTLKIMITGAFEGFHKLYDVYCKLIFTKEASARVNMGPCILYEFLQLGFTKPLGLNIALFRSVNIFCDFMDNIVHLHEECFGIHGDVFYKTNISNSLYTARSIPIMRF